MNRQLKLYIELLNDNSQSLKEEFGVKRFAVFGSIARGDYTSKSDIDIIAEFSEPIGLFDFIKLEEKLKKILGRKVDLATKQSIKPTIKKAVLKEAIYA